MILLAGIPTETPLQRVAAELDAMGEPYLVFHQRRFAEIEIDASIDRGRVLGWLRIGGQVCRLEDLRGCYSRMIDDRGLPEVAHLDDAAPLRRRCRAVHDTLIQIWDLLDARLVNRLAPMASNGSKTYQARLIREHGFHVPETLVSNDPDAVRAFRQRHRRVVYKSLSGVRSIVTELRDEDEARLERIRWCPTQFQVRVKGMPVRVHTVGGEVFATAVRTGALDYRYASQQGSEAELEAFELPAELAERCVALSRGLGLTFAGIDLALDGEGRATCFEVNPCPAFSYYESHTGQRIGRAVAEYLAGRDEAG
ncbi:MAG: hypothetical protein MI919_32840 [Holophagales bacterium]|nr:hypothetical protein [Holophagales bacterium]